MAKIKLGQRPKTFKRMVSFPLVDGTTGQIEMVFKYKTRTEFGEFIDKLLSDAGAGKSEGEFSMKDMMEKTAESNADYILQIAEGWDIEGDFTRANIQQLSDEIPAATAAIMETYRLAISEGRTGKLKAVARAFYEKKTSDAQLAAWGLKEEDLDAIEVWPENWLVFCLFAKVQTQWRLGPGGATGLDYLVVMRLLDRLNLPDAEYDIWLDDIRILEASALEVMHEKTD